MLIPNVKQSKFKNKELYIRPRYIIFFLLFIFAWIMFGLNYSNADYSNYEIAYYDIMACGKDNGYFEVGFFLLVKIFTLLGLSYQGFLVIISAICLIIFTKALSYLTDNILLSFSCYLVYPFVFDIVQYRNFLAFSLVLYGIHYLIDSKSKVSKNIIKYMFCVAIGCLIHQSAIIYSLFLMVLIKRTKILSIVTGVLFFAFIILIANPNILFNVLHLLNLDRYARYDIDFAYTTFYQYCAVQLMFLFLAVLKFRNNLQSPKLKLMIITSLFLPFIIMNGTSARLIRNVYILFYAFIFEYEAKRFLQISVEQFFSIIAVIATVLFVFYSQLCSGLYYDIVLNPILKYNLLFGKLF